MTLYSMRALRLSVKSPWPARQGHSVSGFDAQGGNRSPGLGRKAPGGSDDVSPGGQAHEAEGDVAYGGHDLRDGTAAPLRAIFIVGDASAYDVSASKPATAPFVVSPSATAGTVRPHDCGSGQAGSRCSSACPSGNYATVLRTAHTPGGDVLERSRFGQYLSENCTGVCAVTLATWSTTRVPCHACAASLRPAARPFVTFHPLTPVPAPRLPVHVTASQSRLRGRGRSAGTGVWVAGLTRPGSRGDGQALLHPPRKRC
jgi:hypothetical protein